MSVHIPAYIGKHLKIMSPKPTQIYPCMHLYTYVHSAYNREVVGRIPPGVSHLPENFDSSKINIRQSKMGICFQCNVTIILTIIRIYICTSAKIVDM